MRKTGIIGSGCLPLLIIFIAIVAFAVLSVNNYIKRGKEADKRQISLVVSGKLPDNLQCINEIKIANQELFISLNNEYFRYEKKIPGDQIVFYKNSNFPALIYSAGTYAGGESYYKESLSLKYFDGKTATFLATVSYEGDKTPESHKREFDVTGSFSRIIKKNN